MTEVDDERITVLSIANRDCIDAELVGTGPIALGAAKMIDCGDSQVQSLHSMPKIHARSLNSIENSVLASYLFQTDKLRPRRWKMANNGVRQILPNSRVNDFFI